MNNIERESRILTNSDWNAFGESLWSILSKLTYLNNFTVPEFKKCFGRPRENRCFGLKSERNLNDMTGIRHEFIAHTVGLSKEQFLLSELLPYSVTNRGSDTLRYCPECIKRCFHSPMHQSHVGTHCLWHPDTALLTECSECNGVVEYAVGKALVEQPYRCLRGHWICGAPLAKKKWEGLSRAGASEKLNAMVRMISTAKDQKLLDIDLFTAPLLAGEYCDLDLPLLFANANVQDSTGLLESIQSTIPQVSRVSLMLPPLSKDTLQKVQSRHKLVGDYRYVTNAFRSSVYRQQNADLVDELYSAFRDVEKYIRRHILSFHGACSGISVWRRAAIYEPEHACKWRAAFDLWLYRYYSFNRRYSFTSVGVHPSLEKQWWNVLQRCSLEADFRDPHSGKLSFVAKDRTSVVVIASEYIQKLLLSEYYHMYEQLAAEAIPINDRESWDARPGLDMEELAYSMSGFGIRSISTFHQSIGSKNLRMDICFAQRSMKEMQAFSRNTH